VLTYDWTKNGGQVKGAAVSAGHVVLRNSKTGQSFDLENGKELRSMGGYWSTLDGAPGFDYDSH